MKEMRNAHEWNAGFIRKRREERPAWLFEGKPPVAQRAGLAGRPERCLTCR